MNNTARGIMWVGIFLIAMIIVSHWSTFKAILFSSPNSGSANHPPNFFIPPVPAIVPVAFVTPANKRAG